MQSSLSSADWESKDSNHAKELQAFIDEISKEDEYKAHANVLKHILSTGRAGNTLRLPSVSSNKLTASVKTLSAAVGAGSANIGDSDPTQIAGVIALEHSNLVRDVMPTEFFAQVLERSQV